MSKDRTKPTPTSDETENEFMSRCIPIIQGEGQSHDVAVARCISLWENRNKKGVAMPTKTKIFESEVKAFDDKELTIDHFISTEERDRSGDVVRANGVTFDGVPVCLKQHGFDADTGNEPIAKPLNISVSTNQNGVKGILVKTQYYDGSKLDPPDNTGKRLYEKARDGFMPYWSIRFKGLDVVPFTDGKGGDDIRKSVIYEYSQVGVPDNVGAATVKTMTPEDVEKQANKILSFGFEKANPQDGGTWKFCVCNECGHNEKHEAGTPCGKCPECGTQMQGSNKKVKFSTDEIIEKALKKIAEENEISIDEARDSFFKGYAIIQRMKTIAERVAEELPWEAMRTLWFGMMDELYGSDGSEKSVKVIIKELVELITPHAIAFAQATAQEKPIDIKSLIDNRVYVEQKSPPADPVPDGSSTKAKPPANKLVKAILEMGVKKTPKKFRISAEGIRKAVKESVRAEMKSHLDSMMGKVE